jgi:hypothetical protein
MSTTTTNVIVPENIPIYLALISKAATYPPSTGSNHWKAKAYRKAAQSIATFDKNIFAEYKNYNVCYDLPGIGENIEEFIYNFVEIINTSANKPVAPIAQISPSEPQYVTLYQNDEYNDDSVVYLQWTGNEQAITSLKAMLKYIYKNTDRYDIDLGNEYYTLHININKKLTQNEVDTICKKGLGKCSGIFTFPQEFANIDYQSIIDEYDLGDIIMSFDTDNIYGHFTSK